VRHRHLNHQDYTLAAIDDIIARGKRADWENLRDALRARPELREKVSAVCATKLGDPYAQRYHFWSRYVEQRQPS
jgi:hypothetical protein